MEKDRYTIRLRFWIDQAKGPRIGAGRVVLLEQIAATGSITNAAKAMKMSYRQAWQMLEDMNSRAPEPLVQKIHGGNKGSGTEITPAGLEVIAMFRQVEKDLQAIAEKMSKELGHASKKKKAK
ncbi:MAG TPA: LysR family transcriptional regulator [Flavobacteriales bacterium]|nr:LysR family transcriptional regulator [Flavobacteriales bacterium]